MKQNNEPFDSNISRLVKLSGDSERPSAAFTEKLIGEVLGPDMHAKRLREMERQYPVKRKWIFRISVAACLLVVAGMAVYFMAPSHQPLFEGCFNLSSYESIRKEYPNQVVVNESAEKAVKAMKASQTRYQDHEYVMGTPEAETIDGSTNVVTNNYKSSPSSPGSAHGGTTPPNSEPFDAMFFKNYGVNPFVDTDDDRFSTFATDVDTGSFALCRSYLDRGELPPRDAVRVEEFVNYFKYNYPAPRNDVFAVYADAAPWRFAPDRPNSYLMRIGLKAFELSDADRKPAVLTFVIDVSGSMGTENRLELVKQSLRLLVDHLQPDDRIGIAVYGTNGRKVLDHTGLSNKGRILNAINALSTNGSTNAEEGIRIGYEMASQAFRPGWINRVILCSDGVANVGQTGPDEIFKLIKSRVDEGITLSAMGFGMGNYNDVLMEQLGDKGNGHYAYIDTLDEARRIFCGNLTQVLQVAARDVKLQVEFNPGAVRSYRLIGYENRDVPDAKFRDDKQDGGEVGPGHVVTAMYELKLWNNEPAGNLATVFVRYKDAETLAPTEFNCVIGPDRIHPVLEETSNDFLLAATVTEFAEILRQSYWSRGATLDDVGRKTAILRSRMPGNDDIVQLDMLVQNSRNLMILKKDNAEPENDAHDHPLILNQDGTIR